MFANKLIFNNANVKYFKSGNPWIMNCLFTIKLHVLYDNILAVETSIKHHSRVPASMLMDNGELNPTSCTFVYDDKKCIMKIPKPWPLCSELT